MKIFLSFVVIAFLSFDQLAQKRPASTPTLRKVSVNGTTLTYLEHGTGPAVLFLHSAFSDHRIWMAQREAVAKNYRFIALDFRYFGTAPWPDNGQHFSQETHIADTAAFIRELKAGPVHLVGRSYGARTAIAIAMKHPELVRSLFLNEPGLISVVTDPAELKKAAEDRKCMAVVDEAVGAGDAKKATKLMFECVNGWPGGFNALPEMYRAIHMDNARTVLLQRKAPEPLRPTCTELGNIKIPVEITKGELTPPFHQITVSAVHRCIPGSRLISIEGARHGAPSQRPAAFNKALLAFLGRIEAANRRTGLGSAVVASCAQVPESRRLNRTRRAKSDPDKVSGPS
jgi:pimeloyl-ACP methyl ester carboxylesterase